MGKVVILGGNARSGKSTLAYALVKRGFSRISLDNLQSIIEDSFKIDFENLDDKTKLNFFENIVNCSIEEVINEDTNIVIDMYDYLPSDISKLKNRDKVEVYFLAYPNCSIEEIKKNILLYSKPTDWITQVDLEYLDECVKRFYERNKLLINECKRYNFQLVDTKGGKERDYILKELLEKITNKNTI